LFGHLWPGLSDPRELPALPLVRPFVASRRLLRPLLTSRSAPCSTSPFQTQGEISPDKNTDLPCATAGFTPLPFGHRGFAIACSLASVRSASYPVLVHRLAGSFHASFTPSSRIDALRFPSLTVTCSGEDFHLPICAHAGRTNDTGPPTREALFGLLRSRGPLFGGREPSKRTRHASGL
jgi:hypothetical protein